MYCEQRSQYIRPNSKKNSFRGNYSRKYGTHNFMYIILSIFLYRTWKPQTLITSWAWPCGRWLKKRSMICSRRRETSIRNSKSKDVFFYIAHWAFYYTMVHKKSKNLKNGHFLQSRTKIVLTELKFAKFWYIHSRLKCLGGVPVLWSKWPLASSLLQAIKTCRQACPPGYLLHFS